jgi:hypothetical protein
LGEVYAAKTVKAINEIFSKMAITFLKVLFSKQECCISQLLRGSWCVGDSTDIIFYLFFIFALFAAVDCLP